MNRAELMDWCLMKYPYGYSVVEVVHNYFALPTDSPIRMYGKTFRDTRHNAETTEFEDGHRIITGDLVSFCLNEAITERTIYALKDMSKDYAEWLDRQGYKVSEEVIIYEVKI